MKVPEPARRVAVRVEVGRVLVACDDNDLLEVVRKAANVFGLVQELGPAGSFDFEVTVRATYNVGEVATYLGSLGGDPPEDMNPPSGGSNVRPYRRPSPEDVILD